MWLNKVDRKGYVLATVLQGIALVTSIDFLRSSAGPAVEGVDVVFRVVAWWCVASIPMCLITAGLAREKRGPRWWVFLGLLSVPGLIAAHTMAAVPPPSREDQRRGFEVVPPGKEAESE